MKSIPVMAVRAIICAALFGYVCTLEQAVAAQDASISNPRFVHPGAIYTQAEIDLTKSRVAAGKQPWKDAYDEMMGEADEALKVQPLAPQKFSLPWRYVDPKGNLEAGRQIRLQARAANLLAMASLLTDNADKSKAYATHAAAILKAWTSCQNIGTMQGDDRQAALEACTSGSGFILAADYLFQSPQWPAEDRTAFQQWVRQVYLPATEIKTIKLNNNWNDWGTYGALLSDYVLEDADGLKSDTELLKANIAKQIEPDGSLPKELARGEGKFWYTYYALTAMTCCAVLVHHATDEDLMSLDTPSGASIRGGIDYFIAHLLQRDYRSLIEAAGGIYNDKAYLMLNRGTRPVTGLHDHNGWTFPTLFLQPDDVPINQPPVAVATVSPNPAKIGREVVFDATNSKHPDGDIKSYLWSFEGENRSATFVESLSKAGDLINFPVKQQGEFTLDFDITIEQPGDTAVGLQSSGMSGAAWGSASYLFSINGGRFTARDGASYRSDADLSYTTNKSYHVKMEVNVPLQTWSACVTDGAETTQLAKNYLMREGSVASDISKVVYMGAVGSVVTNVHMESTGETLEGPRITKMFGSSGEKKVLLTVTDAVGALNTTTITVKVND